MKNALISEHNWAKVVKIDSKCFSYGRRVAGLKIDPNRNEIGLETKYNLDYRIKEMVKSGLMLFRREYLLKGGYLQYFARPTSRVEQEQTYQLCKPTHIGLYYMCDFM